MRFPGRITADLRLAPQGSDGTLLVTAMQRPEPIDKSYSVHWHVRFAEPVCTTLIDTGGGMIDAVSDHVASSCQRWQCTQSGLGLQFADGTGVAVAPLDTPLFRPGGPHWRNPHTAPNTSNGGSIWSINTHWDTNFPVRITDVVPARFVLRHLGFADAQAIGAALVKAGFSRPDRSRPGSIKVGGPPRPGPLSPIGGWAPCAIRGVANT